jgi:high-affinity K+ transport system ATPase subunit B
LKVELPGGSVLVAYPHEVCPADGAVVEGRGRMDESYLTGEPGAIRVKVWRTLAMTGWGSNGRRYPRQLSEVSWQSTKRAR